MKWYQSKKEVEDRFDDDGFPFRINPVKAKVWAATFSLPFSFPFSDASSSRRLYVEVEEPFLFLHIRRNTHVQSLSRGLGILRDLKFESRSHCFQCKVAL